MFGRRSQNPQVNSIPYIQAKVNKVTNPRSKGGERQIHLLLLEIIHKVGVLYLLCPRPTSIPPPPPHAHLNTTQKAKKIAKHV